MKPKEALEAAVWMAMTCGVVRKGPHGTPGEVVKRLSKEARVALQDLQAEHTQDRVERWLLTSGKTSVKK